MVSFKDFVEELKISEESAQEAENLLYNRVEQHNRSVARGDLVHLASLFLRDWEQRNYEFSVSEDESQFTDLAKEEARMICHIANAFQNQLLDRHRNHMEALSEMYPHDNDMPPQQWMKESVREFDLLHTIKTKMAERLDAGDRPDLQDGSCGHPDCGDDHRGDE